MTAGGVKQVSGEALSAFLRQPRELLTQVDVTSPPPRWAPLKQALLEFARWHTDRGAEPPTFHGVPLCLFGSEWRNFRSAAPTEPPLGRCTGCQARRSCGFGAEVPAELLPLSVAGLLQRWRDYGATFGAITGSDLASRASMWVERIITAYHEPISLEPSVLISRQVDPAARFVVFPHDEGVSIAAEGQYREVLACVRGILIELGTHGATRLIDALAGFAPMPVPVGMECRDRTQRLKCYLQLEQKSPAQRRTVVDAVAAFAPGIDPVPVEHLQMLGLVFDRSGLHTVKAYFAGQPTHPGGERFPTPLAAEHPMVALTDNRAIATLDVWSREVRRSSKWDFNVRDHYLAGDSAERLVATLTSRDSAAQLRPLLVGSSYRADIVAVGLRGDTVALYMELN